jgi:isochorismate pyruvate lyase
MNKNIKGPLKCENIEDIRLGIDSIDNQIIQLIAQRAEYVKEAVKFKNSEVAVRDQKRVAQVIESKKQLARQYNISPELIGEIYHIMIDYFVNQEIEEWKRKKNG